MKRTVLIVLCLLLCSCTTPALIFNAPSVVANGVQTSATVALANETNVANLQFTVGIANYTLAPGATPSVAFSAVAGTSNILQCSVPPGAFQCTVTPLPGATVIPSGTVATFTFIVNGVPDGPAAISVTGIAATDVTGAPVPLVTVLPLLVTITG